MVVLQVLINENENKQTIFQYKSKVVFPKASHNCRLKVGLYQSKCIVITHHTFGEAYSHF
jgi:hypothetical protein